MAAYEDFVYFRTASRRPGAASGPLALADERDALRAEIEGLGDAVRRLRARHRMRRRATLARQFRRFVRSLLPRDRRRGAAA